MLGDEGRNLSHPCAERSQGGDGQFVRQLVGVKGFRCALERSPQTVERQFSFGQDKPARLKIAERSKRYLLGIDGILAALFIEECRLSHG